MSNTVIGASVEIEYSSVGNVRKALKEAKAELLAMQEQFGATSKEAINAARKVADLKDRIEDAKETADLFDPGKKFQALVTVGAQIASGFAAVQGAMALVGSESEDLQKAMLKVQGAMALAKGLGDLRDFGKSWQQLNIFVKSNSVLMKANAAATALTSKMMRMFGVAVNTTSTSFRVLKTAIVSTGLGVLLIVLGEAIAAIMDMADSTEEAAKADEELRKKEEKLTQAIQVKNEALEDTTKAIDNLAELNILKAKAAGASENELTDITKKAIEERLELRKKDLEKSSVDQEGYFDKLEKYGQTVIELEKFNLNKKIKANEEANKKINENNNKKQQERLEDIEKANDLEKQINEDLLLFGKTAREEELFQINKKYREQVKILKDGGKNTISLTELYNKQVLEINKKYDEIDRKTAEEKKQFVLEFQSTVNELTTRLQQDQNLSEQESARKAVVDKYAKEREELMKQYPNNLALLILLKQNEQAELAKVDADFAQKKIQEDAAKLLEQSSKEDLSFQERLAKVAEREQLESSLTFKSEEERTAFQKANSDARKAIIAAESQFRIDQAQKVADVLAQFSDIVGKETAAGKVLAIASATINTYLAASKALTGIKSGNPLGAAIAIAQTAAVIATGIKTVREIARVKVPGGGGGGSVPSSSGIATASPLAPALSPAVQGQALNAEAINNLGNQASRAYVLNSDIQNNDQRNAYLERNARIG